MSLIGKRLIDAVTQEAEKFKKKQDLNPVGEKVGKYEKYFKDGHKYVYSLEQLDFVLSAIEYYLTEDIIEERIKNEDEKIAKMREEEGEAYDEVWNKSEEEFIKSDGNSGGWYEVNHWRWDKNGRAGHMTYYLRGYVGVLSEEMTFKNDEETNQFFWAFGDWSAYMLGVPAGAAIKKRKAIEKVEGVLREYAESQVIDGLSSEEAKKYIELRVKDEMRAVENTISWLRPYLDELVKR